MNISGLLTEKQDIFAVDHRGIRGRNPIIAFRGRAADDAFAVLTGPAERRR